MKQRRDYSSSPAEKHRATQNLENLRSTLNNDYAQLIQVGELVSSHLIHHLFLPKFL
jgi:hypothetical protein